ncbi:MAG: hypothetical protein AABW88_01515 [Nanoarchaeota archaeon]
MVTRNFDKNKYVVVGIITFLIFSLGLSLGIIVSNARISATEEMSKLQELDFKELQFQYLFMSTLEKTNANCNVLRIALDKSVSDLSKSLKQFSSYKEKSTSGDSAEVQMVTRNYLLDNLNYWMFAKESKKTCKMDIVNILYFHSENNCPRCSDQGVILTYYKQLLEDKLLIFPINVDLEETDQIIKILRSRYNVTEYPSIVIEDQTYKGVIQKDELESLICSNYRNNTFCRK